MLAADALARAEAAKRGAAAALVAVQRDDDEAARATLSKEAKIARGKSAVARKAAISAAATTVETAESLAAHVCATLTRTARGWAAAAGAEARAVAAQRSLPALLERVVLATPSHPTRPR